MLSKIVLFVCLLSVIQAQKQLHQDCGSSKDGGEIVSLTVDGCNEAPCRLIKGQSASMKLSFKTKIPTQTLTSKCYGVLSFIPVPFPLPESDSCKLGAICPVNKDDVNEISIELPIENMYPSIGVDVKWEILGDKNKKIVCFKLPVKIVSP